MRPLAVVLLAACAAAACAAVASAAAPRVETMVVGRSKLLFGPRVLAAPAATLTASGRRCAIGAGTPLAALLAARRAGGPVVRARDSGGSCTPRRAADSAGLYVFGVGGDRAAGRQGWVYKVGHRLGTAGAADPSGPFGTGRRLRTGERLTWFWCALTRSGSCQRTLETRSARRVAPGAVLHVAVSGFDDRGRGRRVAGATVRLAGSRAVTAANGIAAVRAPRARGRARLTASRRGMVGAFPVSVVVG